MGNWPCYYTTEPIAMDGRLDEPAWQKASVLEFYVPVTSEKPLTRTEGRVLWDDNYLYVGFMAYDKDIKSRLTNRDDPTCTEDVLEIFFKPRADQFSYYNFEINALGTIYDALTHEKCVGENDHLHWAKWNLEGLKVGIEIKGTINDSNDVDEYWSMEAAIPFAGLPTIEGRTPSPGDIWQFHLARYDYSVYLPGGVELSSCTHLSEVNFHKSEDWRPLEFVR